MAWHGTEESRADHPPALQVRASPEEAEGVWQRGLAYKVFNPSVTAVSAGDVAAAAPMQEMPVQSAILAPSAGGAVDDDDETVSVAGFAWSGGGRGIVRVDVSADAGETWHATTLAEGLAFGARVLRHCGRENHEDSEGS